MDGAAEEHFGWVRGTADYRLAQQRARELVKSVRLGGWAGASVLPTSHGGLTIAEFLDRYHASAVSRGLRPRSIAKFEEDLRRIAREIARSAQQQ